MVAVIILKKYSRFSNNNLMSGRLVTKKNIENQYNRKYNN